MIAKESKQIDQLTRKQAIAKALNILTNIDGVDREIIVKLQEIEQELPLNRWTINSAIDAYRQYYIDNGELPALGEGTHKRLPSTTTLKRLFGSSSVYQLYDNYLPDIPYKKHSDFIGYAFYCKMNPNYFIDTFKTNYTTIQEELGIDRVFATTYDTHRPANSPCTSTIQRALKCKTYTQLLGFAGFLPKTSPTSCDVKVNEMNDNNKLHNLLREIQDINKK